MPYIQGTESKKVTVEVSNQDLMKVCLDNLTEDEFHKLLLSSLKRHKFKVAQQSVVEGEQFVLYRDEGYGHYETTERYVEKHLTQEDKLLLSAYETIINYGVDCGKES